MATVATRMTAATRTRMREVLEDFGGAISVAWGVVELTDEADGATGLAAAALALGVDDGTEWRPLDGLLATAADGRPSSTAGRIAERPESVSRFRRLSSERISEAC